MRIQFPSDPKLLRKIYWGSFIIVISSSKIISGIYGIVYGILILCVFVPFWLKLHKIYSANTGKNNERSTKNKNPYSPQKPNSH
jgi:hypothetical protein